MIWVAYGAFLNWPMNTFNHKHKDLKQGSKLKKIVDRNLRLNPKI